MRISKKVNCYNAKPSALYFYLRTKKLEDFHICISVPLRLRRMTLERCQRRHSSVFVDNCEHISRLILATAFEQANVYWVHI